MTDPDGNESRLISAVLNKSVKEFESCDDDFRFTAAVAEFGMVLRDSETKVVRALQLL